MEQNGEISHPTDGFIFTPCSLPIGTNAQYTLFKWKPLNLHTFDFKINKEETSYTALVNKKGVAIPFATVKIDTPVGKNFDEKLMSLKTPNYTNGSIVECDFDIKNECFNPLLIRTDKTHPNGIYTVEKTLLNIQENITMQEMINLKKIGK